MSKPWETDSCASIRAHYAIYSIPKAAALWCGVEDEDLDTVLNEVKSLSPTGFGRSIWTHTLVPCLEPRSRAIAEAIEEGILPHGREDGKALKEGDYAAYERRHICGRDLKEWLINAFPNEKPTFLFDDIEQNTHESINSDSFRALQADRDALKTRIDNGIEKYKTLDKEKKAIEAELKSLKAKIEKQNIPAERSETTYQNIIAALLDYISGNLPNTDKHPSFCSEAKLIEAIADHFKGYGGLSKSNLSRKFPEAKRSMQSQ